MAVEPISAKGAADQIPSDCNINGKIQIAASSNTRERTIEIIAEIMPLFRPVKKPEPNMESPHVK